VDGQPGGDHSRLLVLAAQATAVVANLAAVRDFNLSASAR